MNEKTKCSSVSCNECFLDIQSFIPHTIVSVSMAVSFSLIPVTLCSPRLLSCILFYAATAGFFKVRGLVD